MHFKPFIHLTFSFPPESWRQITPQICPLISAERYILRNMVSQARTLRRIELLHFEHKDKMSAQAWTERKRKRSNASRDVGRTLPEWIWPEVDVAAMMNCIKEEIYNSRPPPPS